MSCLPLLQCAVPQPREQARCSKVSITLPTPSPLPATIHCIQVLSPQMKMRLCLERKEISTRHSHRRRHICCHLRRHRCGAALRPCNWQQLLVIRVEVLVPAYCIMWSRTSHSLMALEGWEGDLPGKRICMPRLMCACDGLRLMIDGEPCIYFEGRKILF